MLKRIARRAFFAALLMTLGFSVQAADRFIVVASTTSTQDSGLFDHILPIFAKKTGIEVRVVAKGTGQAIKEAERGDADVLLVHHRPSEDAFVSAGFGVDRRDVMYNDFVLIGPGDDPAGVKGGKDAKAAVAKIAAAKAPFVSRGDNSGTHKAELDLWSKAGIDVKAASGGWYKESGSGMGATLNTASAMNGYALADRGTWAAFKNRGALQIVVEGDALLKNPYGVILVNPAKHPHVKEKEGRAFIDWLTGAEGQAAIASFKVGGETLFFPSAGK